LKRRLNITGEYAFIYSAGAIIYSLLEIAWRGFTHWTMALTGGLCLACIYFTNGHMNGKRLWKKCCVGCIIITIIEFAVGCVVNRILNWEVWDYSDHALNLFGQVCLLYTVIWFTLCVPAYLLCGLVRRRMFGRLK
jgi:uncharacterized membrane protein